MEAGTWYPRSFSTNDLPRRRAEPVATANAVDRPECSQGSLDFQSSTAAWLISNVRQRKMNAPFSYVAREQDYRALVSSFLLGRVSASDFVERYFALWKSDRDAQWQFVNQGMTLDPEEVRLCEVLDRIFTACDSYDEIPRSSFEISAAQLRSEISTLAAERWSHETRA
jgi:hypothetical protein